MTKWIASDVFLKLRERQIKQPGQGIHVCDECGKRFIPPYRFCGCARAPWPIQRPIATGGESER